MYNHKLAIKTSMSILFFLIIILIIVVLNNSSKSDKVEKYSTQRMVFESANSQTGAVNELLDCVVGITASDNKAATQSVGSGFVVSEDGYIVTNYHVVGSLYSSLSVTLSNGKVVSGKTLWGEPVLDLAIVKIDVTGLKAAVLGDAKTLVQGDVVYAIGNPLGLQFQRTVTSGIVSALNRTITVEYNGNDVFMEDLIQTDASINPGNSGGPLVTSNGSVIGINTIKVTTAEGIGFAVPINIMKPVIDSFINTGSFKMPYIGIYGYDKSMAQYLNQNFETIGITIAYIEDKSPAYKAGFQLGDVVTHINKKPVNTMLEVREILFSFSKGDEAIFTIIRNSKLQEIKITIE